MVIQIKQSVKSVLRDDLIEKYDSSGSDLGGGVNPIAIKITVALLEIQQHFEITGDILEIGVLEAKYLSLLHLFTKENEISFGIDPYMGNLAPAKLTSISNLKKLAGDTSRVKFLYMDSKQITPHHLYRKGSPGIRFISIDGNHTEEFVYNDLLLASKLILPGGIIAVDDYFDCFSPGVSVGVTRYFFKDNQNKLSPLISGGNKLFITTSTHYELYRKLLKSYTNFFEQTVHPECQWYGKMVLMLDRVNPLDLSDRLGRYKINFTPLQNIQIFSLNMFQRIRDFMYRSKFLKYLKGN